MPQTSRRGDSSPLVSILIPTFNRAGYLQTALESACAQTYPHLEIIVLDDASTDRTPAVVQAFQEQDNRILYVRNHRNRGLVANWRQGVEIAQGEFFCFLGDDDALEPTFVETLLQPLRQHPELVLAFCDHWVMDGEGRRLPDDSERNTRRWRRARLPEGPVKDFLRVALIDRAVFIGAVLFRRDRVQPTFLADEARAMVDLWLLYRCAQQGGAYYVSQRLASCRWQPGGVSRSWNWRLYGFEGELFCYRHFLQDPDLAPYRPIFEARMAYALTTYGNTLLTLGQRAAARERLRQALRLRWTLRSSVGYALTFLGPPGSWISRGVRWLRSRIWRQPVPNYPEELFRHPLPNPSIKPTVPEGTAREASPSFFS
ncbi:glycosyltransferase family 2 protein [Rhodothermus profundi]|uniref:Glycosyltransferase involved in cell wall bisynthesis n=1 Tax=Rhodothermus profundi TaxID=633813 RepID=A0A1M6VCM2_9BACT|nr:glycosyltransferase family 2 protein [Rhodothermus profundi]SHK79220.1 Glycosyltransferase involved in cell wall bisynthesis [Rhodothermus profundi]